MLTKRLRLGAFMISFLLISSTVHAQFWDRLTNPKVTVRMTHPPGLGLTVARVAFGPSKGNCSDELADAVIEDFVGNGVDVIDREHLGTILAEHKFTLSGSVDTSTAARLGQILGPGAMVFLRVQRCVPEKQPLTNTVQDFAGNQRLQYISRTRVFFKASIQTVDLTTGRIFRAQTIEGDQTEQYTGDRCCPEYPSEYDLTDRAVRSVAQEIHRMFFPWVETRQLIFFDDKDCGLKTAFQLLQGGDLEGARQKSEENLEICRAMPGVKPKVMGHALYNVGMAHFVAGQHDRALEYFGEATRFGGGQIVAEAAAECRRARQLAADMQRVEERAELGGEEPAVASLRSNPDAAPASDGGPEPAGEGVEERLTKLQELFKKGLLTQDEFNAKKAEILEGL